jgi:hypothetical protein
MQTRSITSLRQHLRELLPHLREAYAVEQLAVHGSRTRDEATPSSDLDIVVTFQDTKAGQQISLLDFVTLKHKLEDRLGVPVDLGEAAALRGSAGARILDEAETI